jgi:hypothetical protein
MQRPKGGGCAVSARTLSQFTDSQPLKTCHDRITLLMGDPIPLGVGPPMKAGSGLPLEWVQQEQNQDSVGRYQIV